MARHEHPGPLACLLIAATVALLVGACINRSAAMNVIVDNRTRGDLVVATNHDIGRLDWEYWGVPARAPGTVTHIIVPLEGMYDEPETRGEVVLFDRECRLLFRGVFRSGSQHVVVSDGGVTVRDVTGVSWGEPSSLQLPTDPVRDCPVPNE